MSAPRSTDLPFAQLREDPIVEEYTFEGHRVLVSRQHCIDSMGPYENGLYEFYYDFELIEFALGSIRLKARSYAGDPAEAHLLGMDVDGERKLLSASDLASVVPRAAVQYLRSRGKTELSWLDPTNEEVGYSPIP